MYFRAAGLEVASDENGLRILQEGKHCKFVQRVAQVCFHGPSALARGQAVLYVTERAVFRLNPDGLELIEVAPGISIQEQILDLMEFNPKIVRPEIMAANCFD